MEYPFWDSVLTIEEFFDRFNAKVREAQAYIDPKTRQSYMDAAMEWTYDHFVFLGCSYKLLLDRSGST